MRKFLLLAMVILVAASVAYCDTLEEPHVCIGGILKISGGNSQLKFYAYDAESGMNELNKLLYNQRRIFYKGETVTVDIKGKLSSKPVKKNSVPTKNSGLLNANAPIVAETVRGKLSFGFEYDGYSARILDDKGREIAKVIDDGLAVINTDAKERTYYIEFHGDRKYCYILLKASTPKIDLTTAQYNEAKSVIDYYMRKHNIADYDSLGEGDPTEITELLRRHNLAAKSLKDKQKRALADKYLREHNIADYKDLDDEQFNEFMMAVEGSAITGYMNRHNIRNYDDITEHDGSIMVLESLQSMPEARAVIEGYMKKKRIRRYEELTEKDIEAIMQEIGRMYSR